MEKKTKKPKEIDPEVVIYPGCGGPMFEKVRSPQEGRLCRKCPFCETLWVCRETSSPEGGPQ